MSLGGSWVGAAEVAQEHSQPCLSQLLFGPAPGRAGGEQSWGVLPQVSARTQPWDCGCHILGVSHSGGVTSQGCHIPGVPHPRCA